MLPQCLGDFDGARKVLKHLKPGARPIGAAAIVMQSVKRILKKYIKIPTCQEFQE